MRNPDFLKYKESFCKHYNGREMFNGTQTCHSGINVREIVGGDDFGWMKRIPCIGTNDTKITCEKYQAKTAEEIQQEADELDAAVERMLMTTPLAKKLKEEYPNGGNGIDTCPACNKRIQWRISSYNSHISMVCETDNCIKFME